MARKPKPDPNNLTAMLMDDDTVPYEDKLRWALILSGQDLRKPVDENAQKMDWLAGKFEAEARRRHHALVQMNARRHALVIGVAVVFVVVSVAVVAQLQIL